MPLDVANIGPGKPVLGRHISDLYTVLTGSMTDQPVTLSNNLTVGGVTTLNRDPISPLQAVTKQYADGLITTHTGQADPHPQYLTQAEASALYAPVAGGGYLTPSQADTLYVNVTGDTMTGPLDAPTLTLSANVGLSYDSTHVVGGAKTLALFAQPTRTTPAELRVYRTYTDANNSSYLGLGWDSGGAILYNDYWGTGVQADITIRPYGNLNLGAAGNTFWQIINPTGSFVPSSSFVSGLDLGSNTNWVRSLFLGDVLVQKVRVSSGFAPAGAWLLYPKSDGYYQMDSAGVETKLSGGGGGLTLPLSQHLTFAPDNTYDIGASAANRPRDLNLSRWANVGGLNTALITPTGNLVSQINGLNPQTLRIYNTYTDASNYERLSLSWSGANAVVGTEQAGTGGSRHLIFRAGGGDRWLVTNAGVLGAISDNVFDIGFAASNRPRTIYAGTSVVTPLVETPLIGTLGATNLVLRTNNVSQWMVQAAGHLMSVTDNINDIGAFASGRPRTVYAATGFIGPGAVPTGGTAGQVLSKVDGTNYNLAWITGGGGGLTLPLAQTLTFAPDNTYDIGTNNTTQRPRHLYMSGDIQQVLTAGNNNLGRTGIMGGTDPSYALRVNGNTYFGGTISGFPSMSTSGSGSFGGPVTAQYFVGPDYRSSGVDLTISPNNTQRWVFAYVNGELRPTNDNQVDLGTGAQRVRNAILAGSLYHYNTWTDPTNYERSYAGWSANVFRFGTGRSGTGVSRPLELATADVSRWRIETTGDLLAVADNTYDIGASGASRARSIYAATSFIGPGAVPTGGTTGQVLQKTSATDYAAGWSTVAVSNAALASDTARLNLLTNGGFEIWQRGVGPFTVGGAYGPDRWTLVPGGGSSYSGTQIASTIGRPGKSLQAVYTHAAGGYVQVVQKIEDVVQHRGKSVAYSVKVKSTVVGTVNLRLNVDAVVIASMLNTTTAEETLTATGVVPTSAVAVYFELVLSTASCTVEINDAMLVVGSVAADYAPLHPADDLARCLRYCEIIGQPNDVYGGCTTAAGQNFYWCVPYKAAKAVMPTVTRVGSFNSAGNLFGQPNIYAGSLLAMSFYCTSAGAAGAAFLQPLSGGYFLNEANP